MIPAPTTLLRWASRALRPGIFFDLPARARGHVALTFDDGPHAAVTPRILDALVRADAHATFFFQGTAARAHPELVRRALAEGHMVASHGQTHESARKQANGQALKNATDGLATLEDIAGTALPRLYRPPYGELTVGSLLSLLQHGFRLAFWNYDSNDSFVSSAEEVVRRVQTTPPPERAIMLFHDDYAITADAVPAVIHALRGQNLEPTVLGKFLE